MLFSALISFFGGSAFRMIWGEISSFITKVQDHEQELAMLKLQGDLDAAKHTRDMETIELQAKLNVQQVMVQTGADMEKAAGDAFTEAMKHAFAPTNNFIVDTWNGVIRPAFATICLILWALKVMQEGWKMDEWDTGLLAGIVGFYFADRALGKRGK